MRGSLRERSSGYWQLRAFEGTDPLTGKKLYRTKHVRGTKREAQKQLAVLVTEVNDGVVAPAAKTVSALLDAWIEHIEYLGRSPSTLYGYRRLVHQLPHGFKSMPLGKVTPKVIDDLYRLLGRLTHRKPATVLRFHTLLRAAFAQAVRWGWMDRNPLDRATPPRVQREEVKPPAVEEVMKVLDRAAASRNPENALVFRLLAATGCRRGEVCALKWSGVEFDCDPIRVVIRRAVVVVEKKLIVQGTKTHAVRAVGLDDETARMLKEQWARAVELGRLVGRPPQPDDFVFQREPGGSDPLPPDRVSQAWRRLCWELGVKARLHDLRHLQASLLLDAGEAITTVAARLGHRDTSTTLKVYGHLMPGADQRAAALVGRAFTNATQDGQSPTAPL